MNSETTEDNHVFRCAFGGGVVATAIVDLIAAVSDRQWIRVKWDGLPNWP